MKVLFLALFLVCFSHSAISQIDFSDSENLPEELKNPLEIKGNESTPYQPTQNHSLTAPKYKNGFSKPTDFFQEEEETFTMSSDHGLLERRIKYEPGYLKKDRDSGEKGNRSTQYLGQFSSDGKFVEIYCRDHEYVDGDRVQVTINGKVVARQITLVGTFQPVLVTLEKGDNRIEIKALNEGTSSPNTAEFVIYDDMGNVITQNKWNLATGVKASVLIHKP